MILSSIRQPGRSHFTEAIADHPSSVSGSATATERHQDMPATLDAAVATCRCRSAGLNGPRLSITTANVDTCNERVVVGRFDLLPQWYPNGGNAP
jgi:hypothetical protein